MPTLDSYTLSLHDALPIFYVLDGRGEVRVEGVIHHVAPGHAVFVPAGAEHAYVNTGAALLTLVGAMAPPIELGEIRPAIADRKSTRLNSSHGSISYAVFCL